MMIIFIINSPFLKQRASPVSPQMRSLDFVSKNCYIFDRGYEMAVKVKPVQPTEIKDKKIILEVIEQIRKPIPASVYKRNEKLMEYIKQFEK
jgi:hypothetical protein